MARRSGQGPAKSVEPARPIPSPDQARDAYVAARRAYVEATREAERLERLVKEAKAELAVARATQKEKNAEMMRARAVLAAAIDAAEGLTLGSAATDTDAEIPQE